MNTYNSSKLTSTNNVLPMEINIIFGINTNNSSAERKDGCYLDTLSDFAKKIIFDFIASYLAIQGGPTQNREGEHLSGSGENEHMKRKKWKGNEKTR